VGSCVCRGLSVHPKQYAALLLPRKGLTCATLLTLCACAVSARITSTSDLCVMPSLNAYSGLDTTQLVKRGPHPSA
jgi:hypothetical protein